VLSSSGRQYQLRLYTVREGELDEFVAEWAAQVLPLRREFGFEVLGPWVHDEESLFVWILSYGGDFEAADAAYYESDERRGLTPDPARRLTESQHWLLRPVG
jgi:hypothetical protein